MKRILFCIALLPLPVNARTLPEGVFPITGIDETLPDDDLITVGASIGDANVIALGESMHTSGGFYQAKFRLIKYLVEKKGVRAVALENPWVKAKVAQRYVATCTGSPTEAVKKFFQVWHAKSLARLLTWLCEYNQENPDDKVAFFGFDTQQPWDDVPLVRTFLSEKVPDRVEELMAPVAKCAGAAYRDEIAWYTSEEYRAIAAGASPFTDTRHRRCQLALAEVKAVIDSQPEVSSEKVTADMAVTGLKAFHEQMFYLGEANKTGESLNSARSYEARDLGMAKVFLQMWELYGQGRKAIIWAHNFHISAREQHPYRGQVRSMGYHLEKKLGDEYFPIGIIAHEIKFDWPGFPSEPPQPPKTADYLEFVLKGLGDRYLYVNLQKNGLFTPETRYKWDGEYHYGDLAIPGSTGIPTDHFRGLFYLPVSEAMARIP